VFNLHDAAARDFCCDLVPRGAECHPHGGSGQLAGTYILARRMQETIEAAGDLVPVQLRSPQQLMGRAEWIPILFVNGTPAKVSYVRLLSNTQVFMPHRHAHTSNTANNFNYLWWACLL
jgi:hypothetical protein